MDKTNIPARGDYIFVLMTQSLSFCLEWILSMCVNTVNEFVDIK